ncbi:type II secretion system protein C (GspC) [Marinimicrobium koreense]|uniref:Type II secretion system protein C (GspC) n=1 Tax=Marinimicrobium koreense TaxID=306545 RepID=A0A3N1P4I7_9GAMM|nr:type II secretion system protein GspC [Marinimicrobium koreense]ROQ21620.1 type II secretion system protein C (GspC) [Marinimicrobium koreense]
MSNTERQHNPSASAGTDWRSERLAEWLRQGGVWLARVPSGVWRFGAKFLIVLWLSYTLAQLLWVLIPAPEIPKAQVAPNAVTSERSGGSARAVDIAALASLNIFGEASADEEPGALDGEAAGPASGPSIEDQAVDTDLKLVLRGVMGSNDETAARAIIADGKDQAIYAPGDELPVRGSVTLEKVLPLRVILNNAGRYESLWLYTDDDWSSSLAASQPVPDTPGRSWEGDEEPVYDTPAETPGNTGEAPQEELEDAADEVAARVGSQSLSDVVSMSIHRENGQIVGYKIRPGRDRQLFDSLGLQADDVVKAVNGVELTSPQRVMEIYREMGDARSASLLIDRDGQEVSIDIELE